MSHHVQIQNFGPISSCQLEINEFTILTGPQASGKSTIAKIVYYFRTVKDDILDIMMQGGPQAVIERKNATWHQTLKSRLREKFLQLFGSSWAMPRNMDLRYNYTDKTYLHVFLVGGLNNEPNFVEFEFSTDFFDYLADLDNQIFVDMGIAQRDFQLKRLTKLFDDEYETIFIPAGRNLITLLSNQLNYIFTSMETSQLRNIDYITRQFVGLILKYKPLFSRGMQGALEEEKAHVGKVKNQAAINELMRIAGRILTGTYKYQDGEERLYLDNHKYVKINFVSSGQQESVWIFNLLFILLLNNKRTFLIIEEPEAHLYPEAQMHIAETLALFYSKKNTVFINTHSPYILGAFNNALMAWQIENKASEELAPSVSKIVDKRYWLNPISISAYFVDKKALEVRSVFNPNESLALIENEVIDGASDSINNITDSLLELFYEVTPDD